jgi:hypothetical protein
MSDDALLAILKAHTDQDADNFNELKDTMEAVRKDVQEMKLTMAGQKGFFGGMVFVATGMAALVAFLVHMAMGK